MPKHKNIEQQTIKDDQVAQDAELPQEPSYEPMVPNLPRRKPRTRKDTLENLKELGQMNLPQARSQIQCLPIIGQIEGHLVLPPQNKTTKYEHIIPQLVAMEQSSDVKGILVILNTVGGDVEAGLAIAEMLTSLSKPSVSLVLGGGHSIGVPIAVASSYSYIAASASMTIHPIRLSGLVIGVPQTYEYLDKMQDRVVKFVTDHAEISEKQFRELMFRTGELARDIGTVLVGNEAVNIGLINEVGGLGQAVQKLNQLIKAKPQEEQSLAADSTTDQQPATSKAKKRAKSKTIPEGGQLQ